MTTRGVEILRASKRRRPQTAAQRGSHSSAALLAAVAGCRQPPATQACREVKEEIGGGGWVGASWAHAGQAAESAAMRVPSGGVRVGVAARVRMRALEGRKLGSPIEPSHPTAGSNFSRPKR